MEAIVSKAPSWKQAKALICFLGPKAGVGFLGFTSAQLATALNKDSGIIRLPTDDEQLAAMAEVESWKNFTGDKAGVAAGMAKWFGVANDLLVEGIDFTKASDAMDYWNKVQRNGTVSEKKRALGIVAKLGGVGLVNENLSDAPERLSDRRFSPVGAEAPRSPVADLPRAEVKPLQVAAPVKQTEGMGGEEIFALLRAGFNQEQVEKMWEVRQSLKAKAS